MLARSNSPQLKDLAEASLHLPTDSDGLTKLADRWFSAAGHFPASEHVNILRYAGRLYRGAASSASGLQSLAIEKRLNQIPPPTHLRRIDLLDGLDPTASSAGGPGPAS